MVRGVDVDGRRVAYRRSGAGPAVVLLHGAVCDGRVWDGVRGRLDDHFDVTAWDAPGCGGSADPLPVAGMAGFADALGGLLDALGTGPAVLVGHSWGSTLALETWRRHPARVRALVLVGGYAGWGGSLPAEETARRVAAAELVAALSPGGFDPVAMPGVLGPRMPPEAARHLVASMRAARPAGTLEMARAMAEDLRAVLPTVAVPALVVHGEEDLRSTTEVARALHAGLPHAEIATLPGLGHECHLEDPAAVTAVLRAFLVRVTDDAPRPRG